jgi:DNA repair protein RadD
MQPRPYQQEAHDATIEYVRKCVEPCVIDLPTGAGKSIVIALLCATLRSMSGKRILVTAPTGELVEQNHAKYVATGNNASIFCGSLQRKGLKYNVVFGTPLSVLNSIEQFKKDEYAAVIVDEAHSTTPTIRKIIDDLRSVNEKLRVIGTDATPWVTNKGFIYKIDENDKPVEQCFEPYYSKCVYRVHTSDLIGQGYLSPLVVGRHITGYDTSGLILSKTGKYTSESVDKAYLGKGRLTSDIVADVIKHSWDRRGVMFFAGNEKHAYEILASLPPELSVLVTSKTKSNERREFIRAFKEQRVKYFVNVEIATVGFDVPHVDVIAILRGTESPGLLLQIIGRGLRLFDGKLDCLLLDYAGNIDRHCPDGDIFNPNLKVLGIPKSYGEVKCYCPDCNTENTFSGRKNDSGFGYDKNGYFVDLRGYRIETDLGPMPGHYGRRCGGLFLNRQGKYEQCGYRWTSKTCEACGEDNDIAARVCVKCKKELVNPNDKLSLEYAARKTDPTVAQTARVVSWEASKGMSKAKNECWRIDIRVEPDRSFSVFYPITENLYSIDALKKVQKITDNFAKKPETITYRKNPKTGYYKILDFNRSLEKNEIPEMA